MLQQEEPFHHFHPHASPCTHGQEIADHSGIVWCPGHPTCVRWNRANGSSSSMLLIRACSAFILQAIIMGTVFLKLSDSTATYFSRGGVLFL